MIVNTPPRVSVIVPCYDQGRFLDEAVDSVLAQTFGDLEILVVDDGSTDPDTRALLADYRRPKTRVLRIENRGLPGARNAGIREAVGEYVCCLDADDVLEPTLLEKSVAVLDARKDVAFVSHWLRTFGDESWEWTPTRCDFPALLDANTVNGAAPVRRAALLEAGLFDETMRDGCEDWDLWITLVERGFAGTILPEFLFRYRRRADSMSRLMNQGGGNVLLYERLAQKHADTYRRHLPELFLRRAEVLEGFARDIAAMRLEEQDWRAPELRKKREHVAALRSKEVRARARRALVADTQRLVAEAEQRDLLLAEVEKRALFREGEIIRLQGRVGELLIEQGALREEAAREVARKDAAVRDGEAARHDLARVRESLSWRISAPLRGAHAWLSRRRGR